MHFFRLMWFYNFKLTWGYKIYINIHLSTEITTRLHIDTIAAVHVMVPPVINLHNKEPVVPDGCAYLGPITNCIATKTATIMSASAKFSMSRFMGVLMVLFSRTTRTTIVLPKRSIRTITEKATQRPMYSMGSIAFCKLRLAGLY